MSWRFPIVIGAGLFLAGCTITLPAPPSPKTVLETQVMGTYAALDDEMILVSAVRGQGEGAKDASERRVALAKQNREFNRDDIDELKRKSILGEARDGSLVVLQKGQGLADGASAEDLKLARLLVEEENRDRMVLWQATIATNPNLGPGDLPKVRETFAKAQRDAASPGHWFQGEDGVWRQKTAESGTTSDAETAEEELSAAPQGT